MERQKAGSSQIRWKRGGTRETIKGRDPGNRDKASGKDAEAGQAMGAVGTGGTSPAGWGASWARPAPQPPSPAAARASYQVTKLPQDSGASDWRGCSQSESGAAVLGQEAWRHAHLPTPRKPLTQARWRAPPLSHGHAEFFSMVTHTRRPSHTHMHAYSYTRVHPYLHSHTKTHSHTCTHNTDIHKYSHIYTRINLHVHTHIPMHTHIHMYTCTSTHAHKHKHTP